MLLGVSDLADDSFQSQFALVGIRAVEDKLREGCIEVWQCTEQSLDKSILAATPFDGFDSLELSLDI
jgi:hypothetical protein